MQQIGKENINNALHDQKTTATKTYYPEANQQTSFINISDSTSSKIMKIILVNTSQWSIEQFATQFLKAPSKNNSLKFSNIYFSNDKAVYNNLHVEQKPEFTLLHDGD